MRPASVRRYRLGPESRSGPCSWRCCCISSTARATSRRASCSPRPSISVAPRAARFAAARSCSPRPAARSAAARLRPAPECCCCAVSNCPDDVSKAAVNCRSSSVIQSPHSLDSFKAGRPPTVQGRESSVPAGSTTNRSPSISVSSSPQPARSRPAPAGNAERKAQADHQRPQPRAPEQSAQPSDRRRRIGFDGTQRVVDDSAQAPAEPPQLARGRLLDLPVLRLQPAAEPGGQLVRG